MGIFDFLKGKKNVENVDSTVSKMDQSPKNKDKNVSEGVNSLPVSWSVWPEKVDDVLVKLNQEIETARSQGLRVLMYTYAPWSPGSVGFKKCREDAEVAKLLAGKIHVVEIHFDTLQQLNDIGFPGYSIPQLWLLEPDGNFAGKTETGGAWGDDTTANIHRFLSSWLPS